MFSEATTPTQSFRRTFLERLFRRLNKGGIRYCILRNYSSLYDNNSSDVDMMVDPSSLERIEEELLAVMEETGSNLIRRADFVCRTFIFFDGQQLLHIDLEYSKRWRVFPIVSVDDLLGKMRPYGEFFVPSPEHEILILWSQALCAGYLTERYRNSLEKLLGEADSALLTEVYRRAFGSTGDRLLAIHRNLQNETCLDPFLLKLRKALIAALWSNPARAFASARYAIWDAGRIVFRATHLAGLRCTVVSVDDKFDCEALLRDLDVLFPPSKIEIRPMERTDCRPSLARRLKTGWGDFKRFFRGGVLLEKHTASSDSEVSSIAARIGFRKWAYNHTQTMVLDYGAAGTFAVNTVNGFGESVSRREDVARFLIRAMGQNLAASRRKSRRGLFCVLLGLDGSGKTSVSRALCNETATEMPLAGVRYLHWIPKPWGKPELPLPTFHNFARNPAENPTAVTAILSAARLLKNLLCARAAYALQLRPWISGGFLVLVDRYYYNYLIDPSSVRYTGPDWLLRALLPLFPQPDLLLVLQAEASVLLQRKQEISFDQIVEQTERLASIGKHPRAVQIDASQPLNQVVQEARRAIANAMAPGRNPLS